MASLILTPENQIQRLNLILNKVKNLQELDQSRLTSPPNAKSWCIVEVLEHLSIAYSHYHKKFNEVFPQLSNLQKEHNAFKARMWQKLVIEMQRPKGTQRKWKMKTMKRFEPLLDPKTLDKAKIEQVFQRFFELHGHFKESILESRGKDVATVKIPSAIGPIVQFYLPESFEFLLAHMERHMVQIDTIMEQQKTLVSS
ncbi:DinB family protein [Muricauda sp. CAU 1633]|uniref:DinB family protein n=1 Tax=Allomuricauda sp. CAU 1633 TaxID=2816036 RepID=UPI001A8C4D41|nr:DinB family protein [Muricauda sp. CAU 1633]MBO0321093.1 DinB family protein [Muricauda sp. CAU 1633]